MFVKCLDFENTTGCPTTYDYSTKFTFKRIIRKFKKNGLFFKKCIRLIYKYSCRFSSILALKLWDNLIWYGTLCMRRCRPSLMILNLTLFNKKCTFIDLKLVLKVTKSFFHLRIHFDLCNTNLCVRGHIIMLKHILWHIVLKHEIHHELFKN